MDTHDLLSELGGMRQDLGSALAGLSSLTKALDQHSARSAETAKAVANLQSSVDALKKEVQDLKGPVQQFVSLKARMGGAGVILAFLGTATTALLWHGSALGKVWAALTGHN